MYDDLVAWLETHRLNLINSWAELGVVTDDATAGTPGIATLTPTAVAAADLYTAVVAAAHGDGADLAEQLRLLAATQGQQEVTTSIALARVLRQSTVAL
ncbi:MAG: hypothetical protein N2378_04080, partial [Chloroflexaceae bacterium]|nr:hypothetical protein [Chloroflexaceae bacterium]